MGESDDGALRLDFDRRLMLQFRGSAIISDAGLLAYRELADTLSPTYGDQEGSAYNGHFACTCYRPLFVFNQFGDVERCVLRPGNMHSADSWRAVLEPVIARDRGSVKRLHFRGDAAFGNPETYRYLEAEGIVAFYNQRGTCEQHIKEGKNAIKRTRLSCRSFVANAVRLQLHALVYNLGNFMRTLAMPKTAEP